MKKNRNLEIDLEIISKMNPIDRLAYQRYEQVENLLKNSSHLDCSIDEKGVFLFKQKVSLRAFSSDDIKNIAEIGYTTLIDLLVLGLEKRRSLILENYSNNKGFWGKNAK